ncbi:putative glutamine amidotransferase-like protein, partial [Lachnellula subtilissima]
RRKLDPATCRFYYKPAISINKSESNRSLFRAPDHRASIGCNASKEREWIGGCGSTIVRLAFPGASYEQTTIAKGFLVLSTALHQMHRDMLPASPANVELLGWSERCPVQVMYQKGRLLSMQGHPEYHSSIADELLERRSPIMFGEETCHEAKSRVHLPHDGAVIAAIMLEFLLE